jgi:hypothetical protein
MTFPWIDDIKKETPPGEPGEGYYMRDIYN